jgi:hypothetical protein
MSEHHFTLHLTAVDPAQRDEAIRCVARLFIAGGMDPNQARESADAAVHRLLNSGQEVGLIIEREPLVQAAHAAFLSALGDASPPAAVVRMAELAEGAGGLAQAFDAGAGFANREPAQPEPGTAAAIEQRFRQLPPDDFKASPGAYQTAVMLMSMTQGNGTASWIWTTRLARTTGQVEFWLDVSRVLVQTFGADSA